MEKQGSRANHSGNMLEATVENVCMQKGFKIANYAQYEKSPELQAEPELLLKNVPFTSIYGHRARTEFLLKSKRHSIEARIECKWQQSLGSVDEKLPYLYLNCVEAMPENHIIVIIDGHGWKDGAISWLKQSVAQKKYIDSGKRIDIFSLTDFIIWANNDMR